MPAACAGPSDSGQRLVHSSDRLSGDPRADTERAAITALASERAIANRSRTGS